MNLTPAQIEQIVGEVVRRLRALTNGTSAAWAATVPAVTYIPTAVTVAEKTTKHNANELVLAAAVVTTHSFAGKLTNVRKVVVGPKAVVTPAARDELKKQGVTLERREPAAVIGAIRLLLAGTTEQAKRELKQALIADGEPLESQATQSLGGTLRDLARHASARSLPALVVAAEPFAAVVEANQTAGLRGAIVTTAEQVTQARAEAAVNCFVVPAGKLNPTVLRRIAHAIAAAGGA